MNLILFDDRYRADLLPLAYTRPVAEIRVGITTIREKWEAWMGTHSSSKTEAYLGPKYPMIVESDNLFINGAVFPSRELVATIRTLKAGTALVKEDILIAVILNHEEAITFNATASRNNTQIYPDEIFRLSTLSDVFSLNDRMIRSDYELLTAQKSGQALSGTNNQIGDNIFIEPGAVVEYATINSEKGPVYIGKDTEIMEGCLIRGPFALCEGSQVKMGAKIYGATTVGPFSKIGGEINNCVIQEYSNKGHDGFLGNSAIGAWCNLGADTNNSNLKNNYGTVKMWNYRLNDFQNTGLQFCGLVMGDHSKTGINTMLNTGTVIGVNANVFGAGFPDKFVPSFSWGGADGCSTFDIEKAMEVASRMYVRRGLEFGSVDRQILQHVFEITRQYRN